ncbi:hypothetical protein [Cellulomonas sp. ICMP 17802]|uniref:hypothetical protein n=1 Tax=Cellulomonas sp. ICMP 17802 TaxID=3239199 RepID=UPI00351B0B4A
MASASAIVLVGLGTVAVAAAPTPSQAPAADVGGVPDTGTAELTRSLDSLNGQIDALERAAAAAPTAIASARETMQPAPVPTPHRQRPDDGGDETLTEDGHSTPATGETTPSPTPSPTASAEPAEDTTDLEPEPDSAAHPGSHDSGDDSGTDDSGTDGSGTSHGSGDD